LKLRRFIPVLIIAAGLVAYHNSFRDGFVFDDYRHLVGNPHIRQLGRPWDVIAHTSRPVVEVTLALNYALGGLEPWGYHVVNVCIHILAALTLYGVVRRTLSRQECWSTGVMERSARFGKSADWLAGVISLIWLVHPLQTESVTYVIQRAESLMGLFYLLTLYCLIRSTGASRGGWWQAGAVASCALGMASKPVMVTAPVVALLYDRAFLAGTWREAMRRRWPLHSCLAATWLLLALLLTLGPMEWKDSAGFAYQGASPLRYALGQPLAVLHYLRLSFWPYPLCLSYGQWPFPASDPRMTQEALAGQIVVAVLLAATLWAWSRRPAVGFLGAWFFLILLPTSSFVPVADAIVEHRMYLPLAAVIAAVVLGAFEIGQRLLNQQQNAVLGCLAGGLVVGLFTFLTIQRNRDYSSDLAIWQDTADKCPNNPRAHNNLGISLFHLDMLEEAIDHYRQALRIKPDYAEAHNNLGIALSRQGRLHEAIEHYAQALRIKPDLVDAQVNLGNALLKAGHATEAAGVLRAGITHQAGCR
jgi:protein O-mannosyl-transferase